MDTSHVAQDGIEFGHLGCPRHMRLGIGGLEHRLKVLPAPPLRIVDDAPAIMALVDVRRDEARKVLHRPLRGVYKQVDQVPLPFGRDCKHIDERQDFGIGRDRRFHASDFPAFTVGCHATSHRCIIRTLIRTKDIRTLINPQGTMTSLGIPKRIGYHLKRAQQALRSAMDAALREHGITTPQYSALVALEAGEPLSGAELARRCFVTPQTMNGIIVGMEKGGLVDRTPHPERGRVIETRLTAGGVSLLRDAHRTVQMIEAQMLEGMTAAQKKALESGIRACIRNLE